MLGNEAKGRVVGLTGREGRSVVAGQGALGEGWTGGFGRSRGDAYKEAGPTPRSYCAAQATTFKILR